MNKTIESIVCDACGEELIEDSMYPHKFVLELSVIDTIRNSGGAQYCLAMYPPFEGKRHFCDGVCLGKYVESSLK